MAGDLLSGAFGDSLAGIAPGGFAGPLQDAGDTIMKNIMPGGCTGLPGMGETPPFDPTGGGCFPGGGGGFDPGAIAADSLESAADAALDAWKVDDESSAAETIANKYVKENQEALKDAVKDPKGALADLKKKFNDLFYGLDPGCGMPAVRLRDPDSEGDLSAVGIANILFQGEPVSRMGDPVIGPKAPAPGAPICEGAAEVLSAGQPTAFVCAETAVATKMVCPAACTVLVGGAIASMCPPKKAAKPKTDANDGPAGPESPEGPDSGSGPTENDEAKPAEQGEGEGDTTPAETEPGKTEDEAPPKDENSTEDEQATETPQEEKPVEPPVKEPVEDESATPEKSGADIVSNGDHVREGLEQMSEEIGKFAEGKPSALTPDQQKWAQKNLDLGNLTKNGKWVGKQLPGVLGLGFDADQILNAENKPKAISSALGESAFGAAGALACAPGGLVGVGVCGVAGSALGSKVGEKVYENAGTLAPMPGRFTWQMHNLRPSPYDMLAPPPPRPEPTVPPPPSPPPRPDQDIADQAVRDGIPMNGLPIDMQHQMATSDARPSSPFGP